ncbi:MAG: fluoride efflux transporter CrcB [Bacteroidetes bacterium]|nr:fluoride efflux transporter CrcB [Bacteroidota bacterium]GDX47573.1 putative fluoride ion transporter CrcB [Bacteroidota bacterium]
MIKNIILVGLGGALGSVVRYLISVLVYSGKTQSFPWSTLLTNFMGCLLLGLLLGYFQKNDNQYQELKLLLAIGVCGGMTTFSTFSAETLNLMQSGNLLATALYAISSFVGGVLLLYLGVVLIRLC